MACAAYGQYELAKQNWGMSEQLYKHYLAWARPFCEMVDGRVSYVTGDIAHLWHGQLVNRRYRERHRGLEPFDFDPVNDVRLDEHGCLAWNSAKPAMHEYVRSYFLSRQEDEGLR